MVCSVSTPLLICSLESVAYIFCDRFIYFDPHPLPLSWTPPSPHAWPRLVTDCAIVSGHRQPCLIIQHTTRLHIKLLRTEQKYIITKIHYHNVLCTTHASLHCTAASEAIDSITKSNTFDNILFSLYTVSYLLKICVIAVKKI